MLFLMWFFYYYFFNDAEQRCCVAKVRFARAGARKLPCLSEPERELHRPGSGSKCEVPRALITALNPECFLRVGFSSAADSVQLLPFSHCRLTNGWREKLLRNGNYD